MGTVVTAITSVFSAIGDWLTTTITSMTELFYAEGALTFLGTLTVLGLGISIFFLLVGVISNFLRFRG